VSTIPADVIMTNPRDWPALPLDDWRTTQATLHRWLQIVGKTKLALTPFLNEWWNVALTVTPRGLTTGPIPFPGGAFDVEFDFIAHTLVVRTSAGAMEMLPLQPMAVADFYAAFFTGLKALGVDVAINPMPVEIVAPVIACDVDRDNASYDPDAAHRFWRILLSTDTVLQRYRAPFGGKSSPVLFFWGSFDLTATRFSGRPAPPMPAGTPRFFALAEDQENIAVGFWPGNANFMGVELGEPAFYAYAFPEPAGFKEAAIQPDSAAFNPQLGQFILPYEAARQTPDPAATILSFFQSIYDAAADGAAWDRAALDLPYPEAAQ
jgi:Family of unknown function (DUF5996)